MATHSSPLSLERSESDDPVLKELEQIALKNGWGDVTSRAMYLANPALVPGPDGRPIDYVQRAADAMPGATLRQISEAAVRLGWAAGYEYVARARPRELHARAASSPAR
jgi:hypothetical protein